MKAERPIVPGPQARLNVRQFADEHYRRFLEGYADAILICREGMIVFANGSAVNLLGGRDHA